MGLFVPCILLLMVYAVAVVEPATDSDLKRIMDFISVANGRWSNRAEIEAGFTQHDLIEGYAQPVAVPALGNKPSLFLEYSVNNITVVLNVMEVKVDDKDKNLIRLKTYAFADPSNYKPGEFNFEDLRNLTRDQLRHDPACVNNLVRMSEGVYTGISALCRSMVDGRNPGFVVTLMCDEYSSTIRFSIPAKASTVPYIVRLVGPKFPLIDPPANYTSPCDK